MKKIGLLCLALVLALGTLGVAYAMWYDTLTIDGTISTGSLEIIFASQYDNDPATGANDPCEAGYWDISDQTPEWIGERYGKDYASIASTFEDYVGGTELDGDYATVTLNNAYPCYWGSVIWDIKNVGLIPVKFWSANLTELSKGDTEWPVNVALVIGTRYYVDVDTQTVDETLDPGDDFSFILSCFNCCQIDPYESPEDLGYIDITVHLEQDAEQKTIYDFTIKFVFAQWNEGMPCPPGAA